MSSLQDLLDALEDLLEESEGTSGVNGQSGPLSNPNLSYVSTRLTDSLSNIGHLLSAEHLDNAGTADMSGFPTTLPLVATLCHDKAVTAKGPVSGDDELGGLLKSIRDGINQSSGGYKNLAGI